MMNRRQPIRGGSGRHGVSRPRSGVMSDMSAAPGADHAWLAKVLAGDPLLCAVLNLARNLPKADLAAFACSVDRIKAGTPPANVKAAQRKKVGRAPA